MYAAPPPLSILCRRHPYPYPLPQPPHYPSSRTVIYPDLDYLTTLFPDPRTRLPKSFLLDTRDAKRRAHCTYLLTF